MARKLETPVVVWLLVGLLCAGACAAFYFLENTGLGLSYRAQLTLGFVLLGMSVLIYAFSARKWLLIFLYRLQIFRPHELAQNAVELARAEIADLQEEVNQQKVKSKGDILGKANEILRRHAVYRALRPELVARPDSPPKIELERKMPFGKLDSWLYVHAALGMAAIVVVLLHADFQLGGLVSMLLTVTFLGACLTGLYGGYLYWVVPTRLAAAEVKLGFDETRLQMDRISHEIAEVGEKKPELKKVLELQRDRLESYYKPQVKRKLKLEAWLWFHIPLATAALVLLAFHVFSVWYY
ncbi:MAG: hypothetical protein ACYTFT_06580 [Planctomycetota bacterium]|jgi:hypothetical protein